MPNKILEKVVEFENPLMDRVRQEMIDTINETKTNSNGCLLICLEKGSNQVSMGRVKLTRLEAVAVLEDVKFEILADRHGLL